MDVAPVRDLGALHVHRGRLWLGVPRGVRKDVPGLKWEGLSLEYDGIHHFGGGAPIIRRRLAWEETVSVVVQLGPMAWSPGNMPPLSPAPLNPPRPGDKPPEVVRIEWVGPTRFDRSFTGNFTGWVGDDSPAVRHAVQQLPRALRASPSLRSALISEPVACALLGRLAVAPDTDAVDAVLHG